jgi:hypothetical protein
MEKKLTFVKLANKWYVHLPAYDGNTEDLEMVMGADSLCDQLDIAEKGIITIDIYDYKIPNSIQLEFISSTSDGAEGCGAWYKVSFFHNSMEIWLCDVTKYVFGKFPPELFIKVDF